MIGKTASKAIARYFGGDIAAFEQAIRERFDFTRLPDFGDTLCGNIYDWFEDKGHQTLWGAMKREVVFMDMEIKKAAENPFSGKTVVVTGTLENFTRAGIQARIEELGGRAAGSVSKRRISFWPERRRAASCPKRETWGSRSSPRSSSSRWPENNTKKGCRGLVPPAP